MPIGGMNLVPLADEIQKSKEMRDILTNEGRLTLDAIREHIASDKYCEYLVTKDLLKNCKGPKNFDYVDE